MTDKTQVTAEAIGRFLIEWRKRYRMTLGEAASVFGLSRANYNKYESGDIRFARCDVLYRILLEAEMSSLDIAEFMLYDADDLEDTKERIEKHAPNPRTIRY
jgi:transcriptional regulator with XRE-family HTH domain